MLRLACKRFLTSSTDGANFSASRTTCIPTTTAVKLRLARQLTNPFAAAAAAAAAETCKSLLTYRPQPNTAVRSFAAGRIAQNFRGIYKEKWNSQYELLRQYKKNNGDCLVPTRYRINGQNLGRWVLKQRTEFRNFQANKRSTITQEQINRLNGLGFDWDPLETQWHAKLELLRQYKEENGDCLVPRNYQVHDAALGQWVHKQRKDYWKLLEGRQSAMTGKRINKLNELGLDWSPLETQWNLNFSLLEQYKEANGDCRVPQNHRIGNKPLGEWVHSQRKEYWKRQKGKMSALTQERIKKLNAIDFIWDASENQ